MIYTGTIKIHLQLVKLFIVGLICMCMCVCFEISKDGIDTEKV